MVISDISDFTEGNAGVFVNWFMANITCVVTDNLDTLQGKVTPGAVIEACSMRCSVLDFITTMATEFYCGVIVVLLLIRLQPAISNRRRPITRNKCTLWVIVAPFVYAKANAFDYVVWHMITLVANWSHYTFKIVTYKMYLAPIVLSIGYRVRL